MELHNLVIFIVVSIILILQIVVFTSTFVKVRSFLNILKNPEVFKVHKVYIPVDEIDYIDSDEILNNLEHYQNNPLLIKEFPKKEEQEDKETELVKLDVENNINIESESDN